MLQKLIINADDLGITQAVSDAIFEVYENGSLSSATLMVNMPGSIYAAEKSRTYKELGIGLHVNFTEGKPLIANENLTDAEGNFTGRGNLFKKVISNKIKPKDIMTELIAQYDKIISLGITPTHIDSHEHTHILPRIFPVFVQFARSKNLPLRVTYSQILFRNKQKTDYSKLSKQVALNFIVKSALATNKSFKHPDSFNSIFDIQPYQAPGEEDFKMLIIKARGTVHELMVHPYILSEELKEIYADDFYLTKMVFFQKAVNEYNCLKSFNIKKWLKQDLPNVEVITFKGI